MSSRGAKTVRSLCTLKTFLRDRRLYYARDNYRLQVLLRFAHADADGRRVRRRHCTPERLSRTRTVSPTTSTDPTAKASAASRPRLEIATLDGWHRSPGREPVTETADRRENASSMTNNLNRVLPRGRRDISRDLVSYRSYYSRFRVAFYLFFFIFYFQIKSSSK